jgi:hypothetical protein
MGWGRLLDSWDPTGMKLAGRAIQPWTCVILWEREREHKRCFRGWFLLGSRDQGCHIGLGGRATTHSGHGWQGCHLCELRKEHHIQTGYCQSLKPNGLYPTWLLICLGTVTFLFFPITPFGRECLTYSCPNHCVWEADNRFIYGEEFWPSVSHTRTLIYMWFRWYLNENLGLKLMGWVKIVGDVEMGDVLCM